MVDEKRDRGDSGLQGSDSNIYVLYVMQINNPQKHYLGLLQLTGQFLIVQILLKFYVLTKMLCLKLIGKNQKV